ncbi:MAG: hypothetical protein IKE43_06300 [Coriobacteriales bacterium]|nr:hypothetical protein [Coriobacteriales bacterium]
MSKKSGPTLRERISYAFDNYMSRGVISLIFMLFLVSLVVVVVVGFISAAIGGSDGTHTSPFEEMWLGLMHVLSTGALGKDTGSNTYIVLMLVVTLTGMFVTSALIALINQGIRGKIDRLRKGRSLVLEEGHIVILGFNEGVLGIIEELVMANKRGHNAPIVVMADHDKVDMEERIAKRVSNWPGVRIVCRTGKLDQAEDIQVCSLGTCKSVIIELDDDFMTIKALLACSHLLAKAGNTEAYVTAVIHNEENVRPATIAGGKRAEVVFSKKLVSRLMVQSALQPGMLQVFVELLNFAGTELRVASIDASIGYTIPDLNARLSYETAIGVVNDGVPMVNPPVDYTIRAADQLILIVRKDAPKKTVLEKPVLHEDLWADMQEPWVSPRRMLVLGSDELLPLMVHDADSHSPYGSTMVIAAAPGSVRIEDLIGSETLDNITVELKECDVFGKGVLEDLMHNRPQSIIILADRSRSNEESDARALMLQLRLHDIASAGASMFTVAVEMRDAHNQGLAQVSYMTDFITSDKINALIMAQIADERHKRAILADLLDKEGSAIYMKPALRYVKRNEPVSFYDVSASVARFDEIVIGCRKHTKGSQYEIVLNPNKDDTVIFSSEDSLIVISHSWK